LSDNQDGKAAEYRRKANDLIRQMRKTKDAPARRYLLELANAWMELARVAEENRPEE
jgi:hypothetical protein